MAWYLNTVTILLSAAVQQAEGICCHILPLHGSYPNPRQTALLFDLVGFLSLSLSPPLFFHMS
jgi:hypothetical protein